MLTKAEKPTKPDPTSFCLLGGVGGTGIIQDEAEGQ